MQVAVLVYEGFDELDAIGPYEVLRNAALGGAEIETLIVAPDRRDRATGSHGLTVDVQAALADRDFDLAVVPGGGWNDRAPAGAYAEAGRGELPARLREMHESGTKLASVCTGGMLLAAAGLVGGRRMTTHQGAIADLRAAGAEIVEARVVDDGDLLSCGGVTSGIDLGLWIVEREWGGPLADGIAREMEHQRRGPVSTGV